MAKSFNIRISSEKNEIYPENTQSSFKVKLPDTLQFDNEKIWKIALTSIMYPNVFSTFPGDSKNRAIAFKTTLQTKSFIFDERKMYKLNDIVSEFNNLLNEGEGKCLINEDKFELQITKAGFLLISNNILELLGYTGIINKQKKMTMFENRQNEVFNLKCENKPNLNLFNPEFIMAYSNIVESTIIGGEFKNILRIIPPREKGSYVVNEFKIRNYMPIQNSEISEIEVNFRSHDGLLIHFIGENQVILNLEFSNHQ